MTELQLYLAEIFPFISIETNWTHDTHASWDRSPLDVAYPGNALADEDPDDWTAWSSEITAKVIHCGKLVEGNAYLGETWERAHTNPAESNPDISGYELQMTKEALINLQTELSKMKRISPGLRKGISLCIEACRKKMEERYEQQNH